MIFEDIISFDFKNEIPKSHRYGEVMKESPRMIEAVRKFLKENEIQK